MEPNWTAALDQMTAGARDVAKLTGVYYKGLIEEGVPAEAAVVLANSGMSGGTEE